MMKLVIKLREQAKQDLGIRRALEFIRSVIKPASQFFCLILFKATLIMFLKSRLKPKIPKKKTRKKHL